MLWRGHLDLSQHLMFGVFLLLLLGTLTSSSQTRCHDIQRNPYDLSLLGAPCCRQETLAAPRDAVRGWPPRHPRRTPERTPERIPASRCPGRSVLGSLFVAPNGNAIRPAGPFGSWKKNNIIHIWSKSM